MRILIACLALTALALSTVSAQQLATNTAGHALTSNGATPTPGTPFELNTALSAQMVNCNLAGAPAAGIILGAGSLAAVSPDLGLGAGNEIDIDLGVPATILLNYLDTFAPLNFVVAPFVDVSGASDLNFLVTQAYAGLTVNLQGIIQDAAEPAALGATATGSWDIVNAFEVIVQGDDTLGPVVTLPAGAITLYGQAFTELQFSTNGWIKMGNTATFSDLGENVPDVLSGLVGGGSPAPALLPLWEDLDFGNNVAIQNISMTNPAGNIYQFTYNNIDYFPATAAGTMIVTIDASNPGAVITYDYTAATPSVGLNDTIVGITSGNTTVAPTVATEFDLVVLGAVNPFTPGGVDPQTIYQDFGGAIFNELEDLDGLVLNFFDADIAGNGNFIMF